MSTGELTEMQARKKAIREQAHANRKAQENKEELSSAICEKFVALPAYAKARTVMYYLDVRTEVRTRHYLPTALAGDKRIVVPYCVDGELELFHLTSMDELDVGMYKILEPKPELRTRPDKRVEVDELDLIMASICAATIMSGASGRREECVGASRPCSARLDESRGYWCPEIQIGYDARPDSLGVQCPGRETMR